jgi:predicted phosphodiesterase
MTRIRVHSDLHLEFQDWRPPQANADVVVLAGDIHVGVDGLHWARRAFPTTEVVYVLGNHEYYEHEMPVLLNRMRQIARELDIHLLECSEAVIGETRFLGATLWTGFTYLGTAPTDVAMSMAYAQRAMIDYRVIRTHASLRLRPEYVRDLHLEHRSWLTRKLAEPFAGSTVVVTHHLPHERSVHSKYAGDILNSAFATHLPTLVRPPVSLWIHGHTHESMDYVTEGTRVVCNPRGYLPADPNKSFDPTLVVAIA